MPRKSLKFRGVAKHMLDNRNTPSTSSDILLLHLIGKLVVVFPLKTFIPC